ncbi:hypothetical protein FACUT_7512 [Fusarium acutatum]|uniref:Uncharacterized protein n=1 Tax=Fusarium acutatum TaxID=78861 RepID=A0A8H4NQA0_9HYPO|nr:hypothetical protein FACUT_7512 [Fusarium acutatum]
MGNTLERPTAPEDDVPRFFHRLDQQLRQLDVQNHQTPKSVAFLMKDPDLFERHAASSTKDSARGELPADMLTIRPTLRGRRNLRNPKAKDVSKDDLLDLLDKPWTREIGGAWVELGDGAAVTNVTLLSDFSAIQLRHLPSRSSARSVQELLADVGISVSISDINFIKLVKNRNGMAIVKVKDPEFANPDARRSGCYTKGRAMADGVGRFGDYHAFGGYHEHLPPSGGPHEVQMGDSTYDTDTDIDSTIIKSLLYDIGALEEWEVFGSPTARRVKAQARFIEDSEALDAVAQLNEICLPFNPSGKLYLQHVHLVKFRVSTRVYGVVEESIESLRKDWERQFVYLSSVPERGYRVLKLDSQDRELFMHAKEALEKLSMERLWSPDFKADRGSTQEASGN